jgi:hypothetical protein
MDHDEAGESEDKKTAPCRSLRATSRRLCDITYAHCFVLGSISFPDFAGPVTFCKLILAFPFTSCQGNVMTR